MQLYELLALSDASAQGNKEAKPFSDYPLKKVQYDAQNQTARFLLIGKHPGANEASAIT